MLICSESKFDTTLFLYALRQNVIKIEFKYEIRRMSFLCCLAASKVAWIDTRTEMTLSICNLHIRLNAKN